MKEFCIFTREALHSCLQRLMRECSAAAAQQASSDQGCRSASCQLIREYLEQEKGLYGTRISLERFMLLFVAMRKSYRDNHRIVVPGNDYQAVFLNWFDDHISELAPLIADISPTDAAIVQHNYTAWLMTSN